MVLVSVTIFFAGSANPTKLVYRVFSREVSSSTHTYTHTYTHLLSPSETPNHNSANPLGCPCVLTNLPPASSSAF